MSLDAVRAVLVVVGLGSGVAVTDVQDRRGGSLVIGVGLEGRACCRGCGGSVWAHGSSRVRLVDLPTLGRPVRLVWRKRRWRRPDGSCQVRGLSDAPLSSGAVRRPDFGFSGGVVRLAACVG